MARARHPASAVMLALALLAAPAMRIAALDLDAILKGSQYSPAEQERIRSIFAQADRLGVPRELLLPRLAEGAAKRVAMPRLVGVLAGYLGRLEDARSELEDVAGGKALLADSASWSLSATLLEAGASEQDIGAMAAAAGGKPGLFRSGGLLYASLVSWGASRQASLQVAISVVRSALPPEQFPGVINIFEQGRQRRIAPDRLAERIVQSLPGVTNIDDLRRAVLY